MDFLASPDCFPVWRVAPSSLRIAARRDDAGQRPYLVRGTAGCDRSRPVSDRHCHGRGVSESRRLGRVLTCGGAKSRGQAHIARHHRGSALPENRSLRRDHNRITHSRHRTALGGHQRTPAWSISYSRGRRGSLSDTGGHDTDTVRDREAPGSNPGPPTRFRKLKALDAMPTGYELTMRTKARAIPMNRATKTESEAPPSTRWLKAPGRPACTRVEPCCRRSTRPGRRSAAASP